MVPAANRGAYLARYNCCQRGEKLECRYMFLYMLQEKFFYAAY